MAEEPFLRRIAERLVLGGALAHATHVENREAEHRGIGRNAVAGRPAEQAEHRLAQPSPLEVPQRAVDRADRQHGVALAAVHHDAVHLIPKFLVRDRVLAEDDRAQTLRHEGSHHVGQRAGDADGAFVGLDADEVLFQAEMAGVDLAAALEVVARAIFGIDVDRPDQSLLPERSVGRHGSGQPQKADGGDLHQRQGGSVVRRERLGGPQLRLADHTLVTVLHVLHPILEIAALVRQRPLDRVGAARDVALQPIGHEMHRLSDLEIYDATR